MNTTRLPRHLTVFLLSTVVLLPALVAAESVEPTTAVQMVRLEEIEVSADRTSALTAAPTDTKLEARQPKSVISLGYIANNITPTADYGRSRISLPAFRTSRRTAPVSPRRSTRRCAGSTTIPTTSPTTEFLSGTSTISPTTRRATSRRK